MLYGRAVQRLAEGGVEGGRQGDADVARVGQGEYGVCIAQGDRDALSSSLTGVFSSEGRALVGWARAALAQGGEVLRWGNVLRRVEVKGGQEGGARVVDERVGVAQGGGKPQQVAPGQLPGTELL